MELTLHNPYKFEGKSYEKINVGIEAMTGKEIAAVQKAWQNEGNLSPMPAASTDFAIRVAAKASKLPLEFFEGLPANDYMRVAQAVTLFLLG